MSESNINVTPGSGGPNVDLELIDNGNARQVVCIGDPSVSANVAAVDASGNQKVSVSNFPATQPVSLATAPTTPITAASLPLPALAATSTKQSDGSQTTQIVDNSGHNVNVDPSGTMRVNVVTPATLPSKPGDVAANRTRLVLSADAITSVVAEAMMTFQSYKAGAVTAGLTSYTVTSGKTLKITCIKIKIRPVTPSTTVTFANTVLRLREGSLITSPLIDSFPLLMQTNTDSNPTNVTIPDGLEFPSGTVLGMSHLASAATILEHFAIIGYEY